MLKVTLLIAAIACLSGFGCNTAAKSEAAKNNQQAVDGIRQKLEDAQNPKAAIPAVREYALEKMEDLTDAEENIISSTDPKIRSNYEQTEYSYIWKVDGDKRFVEVLSTPAPFIPIGAFRVNRVYYP